MFKKLFKKKVLLLAGLLLTAASCASDDSQRTSQANEFPGQLSFSTAEGTWMSVSASPAGDSIVFDLLGDLYIVDASGGKARRLTSGPEWDIEPRFSPAGDQIAFVSDRDGTSNIWLVAADGTGLTQVSRERFEGVGSPAWSPDGASIYARQKLARRSFSYKDVWVINAYSLEDGARRGVVDGAMSLAKEHDTRVQLQGLAPTGPSAGPDGSSLYFAAQTGNYYPGGRTYVEYQVVKLDLSSGQMSPVTTGDGGAFRPEVSPDGHFLAFGRREAELTSLWLRDLGSGEERRLLAGITRDDQGNRSVDDMIPAFSWTADSESIVISKDGGIVRIDVRSGETTRVPFEAVVDLRLAPKVAPTATVDGGPVKARIIRWHRLSPDGKALAFQALGKIWLMDMPGGKPVPLNGIGVSPTAYSADALFEFAPAWSPDGKAVVYATWSKDGSGHVYLRDLGSGSVRQLTSGPGEYSNLAFSPDGLSVAYGAALPPKHLFDRPGAEIRTINLASGEEQVVARTRPGFPAPVFSADSERIYYVEHTGRRDRQFVSVGREGGDKQIVFTLDWLSKAVTSPDGRRVALVVHDSAYTMDLPATGDGREPLVVDDLSIADRVSSAADSVAWVDNDVLVWGYGDRFYSKTLGSGVEPSDTRIELLAPRDRPNGVAAILGAKLITMTDAGGGIVDTGDLLIENNRILRIGPSGSFEIPGDAYRIDASGTTILPGFVDLHAHPTSAKASGLIEQQLRGLQADLAYGVTTIHDPASDSWYALGAAELVETGQILGPRYYGAGAKVVGFSTADNEWIDSLDTARTVIDRRKRLGAMSIKEYGQPSRIQRQWLTQAAGERGMRIITEGTGGFHLPMTVAVDGFTGIEHSISQVPLYRDVIELLAFSQIVYDPVLVGPRAGAGARVYFADKYPPHEDMKLRRYVDKAMLGFFEQRLARAEHAAHDYVFIEQGREAHKIARKGGVVVTGSHGAGASLHMDIWGYVVAGMTPVEALHTATLSGISAIGLDGDLGTLEPGKLADFIVLDRDPLEDIRNTMQIRYVVKNGRIYDDESLDQVWPEEKQKPASYWLRQGAR